jgi:hypothetical protein
MNNLRQYIRNLLEWHEHLDKVMKTQDSLPFNNDEEPEIDDNPLNPYDANNELRKVKANAHPRTQRAGVKKGSGAAGQQRTPGGSRQGTGGY